MRADLRGVAAVVTLGAAAASIGYTLFAIARLDQFASRRKRGSEALNRPPVTVFKPVAGIEPELEQNLRSFCVQRYPAYDVVFGVLGAGDPALALVQRIAREFPERTRVVIGDGVARFTNPKVSNLAAMLDGAGGEIFVIVDSDMRVGADYLRAIAAPFADPRVGAVTAIYRGEPAADDLASLLGAMWISEQFAPSTLVAAALEPLAYTFGSTMAVRRTLFEGIGGAEALGETIADDHTLGQAVRAHGFRVALADYVVANVVAERSVAGLFAHELRWARTIRGVRPRSYAGIVLTYPIPLAVAGLLLARNRRRAAGVLVAAAAARLMLHRTAHRVLGTRRAPLPALIPLRDALGIVTWAAAFLGRRVRWRDATLEAAKA